MTEGGVGMRNGDAYGSKRYSGGNYGSRGYGHGYGKAQQQPEVKASTPQPDDKDVNEDQAPAAPLANGVVSDGSVKGGSVKGGSVKSGSVKGANDDASEPGESQPVAVVKPDAALKSAAPVKPAVTAKPAVPIKPPPPAMPAAQRGTAGRRINLTSTMWKKAAGEAAADFLAASEQAQLRSTRRNSNPLPPTEAVASGDQTMGKRRYLGSKADDTLAADKVIQQAVNAPEFVPVESHVSHSNGVVDSSAREHDRSYGSDNINGANYSGSYGRGRGGYNSEYRGSRPSRGRGGYMSNRASWDQRPVPQQVDEPNQQPLLNAYQQPPPMPLPTDPPSLSEDSGNAVPNVDTPVDRSVIEPIAMPQEQPAVDRGYRGGYSNGNGYPGSYGRGRGNYYGSRDNSEYQDGRPNQPRGGYSRGGGYVNNRSSWDRPHDDMNQQGGGGGGQG
ncbi:hypothetical protein HK101_003227 [Irineochytrium annulatum]|nr:hypothetical protein HK101_003227 [Irineochytrium annulatum]